MTVNELKERIQHHASRLEKLQGEENKRIKKRVLATLGKLKKELQSLQEEEKELMEKEVEGGSQKRKLPPQEEDSALNSSQLVPKKKLKNKVNMINNELKELGQKKCLNLAVKKFKWAKKKGLPLNIHSYTNLLNAYVRCAEMDAAEDFLREFQASNIPINIVAYTILLKGYAESGNLQAMHRIMFDLIPSHQLIPNERTVLTFLRGCTRIGAVKSAYSLRTSLTRWNLFSSLSIAGQIVQLLCQSLDISSALLVLNDLQKSRDRLSSPPSERSLYEFSRMYFHLAKAYLYTGESQRSQEFTALAVEALQECTQSQLRSKMMGHSETRREEKHILEEDHSHTDCSSSYQLFQDHQMEDLQQSLESMEMIFASSSSVDYSSLYLAALSRLYYMGNNGASDLESPSTPLDRTGGLLLALVEKFGLNVILNIGKKKKEFLQKYLSTVNEFGHILFSHSSLSLSSSSFSSSDHPQRLCKLEICSGDGEWVVAQAQADPHADWIALELRCSRVANILHRTVSASLSNLYLLGGDAAYILPHRIAPSSISHIFINHPEPPERIAGSNRVQGKHLLTASFFVEMHRALRNGGKLAIVSDNLSYMRSLGRELECSCDDLFENGSIADPIDLIQEPRISFSDGEKATNDGPRNGQGNTCSMDIYIWRGDLPLESGVTTEASSYFNRLWERGHKRRRWILYVVKKCPPLLL